MLPLHSASFDDVMASAVQLTHSGQEGVLLPSSTQAQLRRAVLQAQQAHAKAQSGSLEDELRRMLQHDFVLSLTPGLGRAVAELRASATAFSCSDQAPLLSLMLVVHVHQATCALSMCHHRALESFTSTFLCSLAGGF